MASHPGLPLRAELVRPDLWVAEIVYFPIETPLVSLARSIGCRVVDGGGMAVYQAVGAFELFTGISPDDVRMRAHFNSLISDGTPRTAREIPTPVGAEVA
jgi:shikimate dehydrogenase